MASSLKDYLGTCLPKVGLGQSLGISRTLRADLLTYISVDRNDLPTTNEKTSGKPDLRRKDPAPRSPSPIFRAQD